MAEIRIVAAVAHHDEPQEFLDRLEESLAGLVDETVLLDGRWDLMPGDAEAFWPSQVAKRDELMQQAGGKGDWVLVVDGDEYVEHVDAAAVRAALSASELDVASAALRPLNRPWPYAHLAPMSGSARRLFRSGARVVGPAHNDYGRDGQPLSGAGVLAEALDLTAHLALAHDNRARPAVREEAGKTYRRRRRARKTEAPQ